MILPENMNERMTMMKIKIRDVGIWEECPGGDILDFDPVNEFSLN